MNNLIYIPKPKIIFLVLLLFIKISHATNKLDYNNFNLTNNELIAESIVSSIGVHLINTSFWFGTMLIAKKLIALINYKNNNSGYEYIGEDDRSNNKNMLINASLINLAEVSLVGNAYQIIPNNYILLALKAASFLGVIKFSLTKNKTKNEIFNRIMLLILLENITTIIPNSAYTYYETKYPLEYDTKINSAGVALSTTSALIASMYIYDLAFNKTSSPVKSLAFFILTDITLGIISSLATTAIINRNIQHTDQQLTWIYQLSGYCIFTMVNSVSVIACSSKIKEYLPYLYSCLIATYGFGGTLFILTSLISTIVKSDFFWQDANSDFIGVLSLVSMSAFLLLVNTSSAVIAYKYADKLAEKLQSSKKHLTLATFSIIASLGISLVSSGLLSFSYNQPFKNSLLYLNQMVLKKFYSILQYGRWIFKM